MERLRPEAISRGRDFSQEMKLHRQRESEGSCLVYSLWMSAEAIGATLFDEDRVRRIYHELVDTSGGWPGVYPKDLIPYVQRYIPELAVRVKSVVRQKDHIAAAVMDSFLGNKGLVALDFKKGHAVSVRGLSGDGFLNINDPQKGKVRVSIGELTAQNVYRSSFLEVGRAT